MKTFILAAVAAVGLSLASFTGQASAHWEYRNVQQWDSCCGHYVVKQERVWVPDCNTVVCNQPCDANTCPVVRHGHYRHVSRGRRCR